MATATRLAVALETVCAWDICRQFARPLYEQMSSGRYDRVSLLPIPSDVNEWRAEHRTARKRADRCERRGYWFAQIARHEHTDALNAINQSATHRQGRPMSNGYLEDQEFSPLPVYPCSRHAIRDYGVLSPDDELVAYLWLYRCGDLALVSQILGHADHLQAEIMWLLWQGMLWREGCFDQDGMVIYNRHDSGGIGLRWWKEHVGLKETAVEWLP